MKEFDGPIADLDQAIRIDPKNSDAFVWRGWLWLSKEQYEKATADCTEAIRLDPNSAFAYECRGKARVKMKEFDGAIADLDQAIRIDPKNSDAYAWRGWLWLSKKQYEKAMSDLDEAVRLGPVDESAYGNRALILATCPDAKLRDGKKAVESATKACELAGWKSADLLVTLAAACAEAGDFESAVKWQTRANELRTDPEAKEKGGRLLKRYQAKQPYRDRVPEPELRLGDSPVESMPRG
jgi:tetratricopeptide (TPR) repeat protein